MTDKLHPRISQALVKAGYTNPRNGEHSVRALTRELGLNNSRVSRYLHHGSNMQLEARQQVADAIGMTLAELDSLVAGRKVDTYSPPANANLLDHRERTLINEMINLLAERHLERKAVGNDADSSASNEQAAGSAAQDDGTVVPLRSTEKAQGDDMPTEEELLKMAAYKLRPGEDESRRRDQEWSELGEESQDPDQ